MSFELSIPACFLCLLPCQPSEEKTSEDLFKKLQKLDSRIYDLWNQIHEDAPVEEIGSRLPGNSSELIGKLSAALVKQKKTQKEFLANKTSLDLKNLLTNLASKVSFLSAEAFNCLTAALLVVSATESCAENGSWREMVSIFAAGGSFITPLIVAYFRTKHYQFEDKRHSLPNLLEKNFRQEEVFNRYVRLIQDFQVVRDLDSSTTIEEIKKKLSKDSLKVIEGLDDSSIDLRQVALKIQENAIAVSGRDTFPDRFKIDNLIEKTEKLFDKLASFPSSPRVHTLEEDAEAVGDFVAGMPRDRLEAELLRDDSEAEASTSEDSDLSPTSSQSTESGSDKTLINAIQEKEKISKRCCCLFPKKQASVENSKKLLDQLFALDNENHRIWKKIRRIQSLELQDDLPGTFQSLLKNIGDREELVEILLKRQQKLDDKKAWWEGALRISSWLSISLGALSAGLLGVSTLASCGEKNSPERIFSVTVGVASVVTTFAAEVLDLYNTKITRKRGRLMVLAERDLDAERLLHKYVSVVHDYYVLDSCLEEEITSEVKNNLSVVGQKKHLEGVSIDSIKEKLRVKANKLGADLPSRFHLNNLFERAQRAMDRVSEYSSSDERSYSDRRQEASSLVIDPILHGTFADFSQRVQNSGSGGVALTVESEETENEATSSRFNTPTDEFEEDDDIETGPRRPSSSKEKKRSICLVM